MTSYLLVAASRDCFVALQKCIAMMDYFGVPLDKEKSELPRTTIEFLGIVLDSDRMELRLPQDKIVRIRQLLIRFLALKKVTLWEHRVPSGAVRFCF